MKYIIKTNIKILEYYFNNNIIYKIKLTYLDL